MSVALNYVGYATRYLILIIIVMMSSVKNVWIVNFIIMSTLYEIRK